MRRLPPLPSPAASPLALSRPLVASGTLHSPYGRLCLGLGAGAWGWKPPNPPFLAPRHLPAWCLLISSVSGLWLRGFLAPPHVPGAACFSLGPPTASPSCALRSGVALVLQPVPSALPSPAASIRPIMSSVPSFGPPFAPPCHRLPQCSSAPNTSPAGPSTKEGGLDRHGDGGWSGR